MAKKLKETLSTSPEQVSESAPRRNSKSRRAQPVSPSALQCRWKFLRFFPDGFQDDKYIDWERGYKWTAHEQWGKELNRNEYRSLLIEGQYIEIAERAVRIESRTNLLFSFEKMALRDAVKSIAGASLFSVGLYELLYGPETDAEKFDHWRSELAKLPRKKTRVATWPMATVFGFIATPQKHIFLKPAVTRAAAEAYGFSFEYGSELSWSIYESFLTFADTIRCDLRDLEPRDMIDIQSFMWVQGSDEYNE